MRLRDEQPGSRRLIATVARMARWRWRQALARRADRSGRGCLRSLPARRQLVMLLLRMAGSSRELAARLLAGPGDLLEIADAGRAIARFDAITTEEVEAAREWLRLDANYRSALAALGQDHRQRAV